MKNSGAVGERRLTNESCVRGRPELGWIPSGSTSCVSRTKHPFLSLFGACGSSVIPAHKDVGVHPSFHWRRGRSVPPTGNQEVTAEPHIHRPELTSQRDPLMFTMHTDSHATPTPKHASTTSTRHPNGIISLTLMLKPEVLILSLQSLTIFSAPIPLPTTR